MPILQIAPMSVSRERLSSRVDVAFLEPDPFPRAAVPTPRKLTMVAPAPGLLGTVLVPCTFEGGIKRRNTYPFHGSADAEYTNLG